MLLENKVVMISGVGPGLGTKLALESARQGAKGVALLARDASRLAGVAQKIDELQLPTKVLSVATDITIREQCEQAVTQATNTFGTIDVLVNCAFTQGAMKPMTEVSMEEFQLPLNVNLLGTLSLTQVVIPVMKRQNKGSIVMVNTMETRKPVLTHGPYAISKAALSTAAACLAQRWPPRWTALSLVPLDS